MSIFDTHRPAWMEIDIAALQHNYALMRKLAGVPVMAVVKADAYGHGAVPVALALAEAGATRFAVATAEELAELRSAGIACPILVLGFVAKRDYPQLLYDDGLTAVYSMEQAEVLSHEASRSCCVANIHIKIDSGMSRIGFPCTEEAAEEIAQISRMPSIRICGVFSHFACADELDCAYNEQQLRAFQQMVALCQSKGVEFPLVHMGNSAAILQLPQARFDMMRAGIALYGAYPDAAMASMNLGLKPVMSVKARIVRIQSIAPGIGVSYGCTWVAKEPSVIATLPLGYADGVPRLLSNCGHVLIGGKRAPIVGRVCMDQFMVDITAIAKEQKVEVNDEAVFLGRQGDEEIGIDEIAAHAQTVNYEILCHLGHRLPRNYIHFDLAEVWKCV